MKALWAYIKEHELQNPDNKKVILVSKDEKLHGVLGVDKCEGFSMSKCAALSVYMQLLPCSPSWFHVTMHRRRCIAQSARKQHLSR